MPVSGRVQSQLSYYSLIKLFFSDLCIITVVIRSVTDVHRAQNLWGMRPQAELATPFTNLPTLGRKYVSNRLYNKIITPATFI